MLMAIQIQQLKSPGGPSANEYNWIETSHSQEVN
jgi:hypothetical protein